MASRRSFLKMGLGATVAGAGGLIGLRPGPLHAQTPRATRKLVIVVAYGGWDPMWALDPKPDSPEVDQIPGSVQMFGDAPVWTDASRPAVTEFFTQWGDRTAILNGIAVDSLAHETCAKVMLTGAVGSRPDVGARVADALGSHRALPYLALSPHAKVYGTPAQAGQFGLSNQLMALTQPQFGWPAPGQTAPDMGLQPSSSERDLVRQHLEARMEAMAAAADGNDRSTTMMDEYTAALGRADALQDAARNGGVLSDLNLFNETDQPWDHVAGSLAEGLSQAALVQPDLFWDTHGYNASQGDNFETFFGGLGLLMTALNGRGIVDDTVVLVISEMGRTPRHNSQGGKDHWPWTSAMLIGPGVRGGRAYGQTDDWLQPEGIDLTTGAATPDGELLHAEHVLHATAKLAGVENADAWFERGAIDAVLD